MFLIELLETYPHYLGDQEGIGDLPFMFKVLSIDKALSIQVFFLCFFLCFLRFFCFFCFFLYSADRCVANLKNAVFFSPSL